MNKKIKAIENGLLELYIFFVDVISFILPRKAAHLIINRLSQFVYRYVFRIQCGELTKSILKAYSYEILPKKASKIACESFASLCLFLSTFRYLSLCSVNKIKPLLDDIMCEGLDFAKTADKTGRPILVVTIHCGDFFLGFLKLASLFSTNRPIGIVKLTEETTYRAKKTYTKFREMGLRYETFSLLNRPGLEVFKFLLKGNIIFTMYDVKHKYIKTTQVNFFNQPAFLPCGPAELAIISKAIILPVIVAKNKSQKLAIRFEPHIDTMDYKKSASSFDATKQLTQKLASLAENWIKTSPDQWHHWLKIEDLWIEK